jgi:hypothetical protein
LEEVVAGFPVDEHEIRLHAAVAKILPFAAERMIGVFCRQRRIGR